MSRQKWVEPMIIDETQNGATFSNSSAETILFPDFTVPAFFMYDNVHLRYTAYGKFSNIVTSPGNLTFFLRWGGVGGTILAQSSAISLNIVVQTDVMWQVVLDIVGRSNGSSASIIAMGVVQLAAQLAANNNQPNFMGSAGGASGNTPAAVGSLDMTVAQALTLSAKFGTANSGNAITGMVRTIESLT